VSKASNTFFLFLIFIRMNEVMDYIRSQPVMDKMFLDDGTQTLREELGTKLRGLWDRVFKKDKRGGDKKDEFKKGGDKKGKKAQKQKTKKK